MTRVKSIGVNYGGGDTDAMNSVVRGVARPAINATSMRAAGNWFEGRA